MNLACERCDRRYEIPDEKVAGRSFKITCRGCGHVIVVRAGTPAVPAARAPSASPAPAAAPAPPVLRRAPPSSAVAAPSASAGPAVAVAAAPRNGSAAPAPVAPWPAAAATLAAALPAPPLPRPAAPARPAAATPVRPSPVHLVADAPSPTEEHRFFTAAQLSHLPGVTAEWLLANRRRHPRLLPVALGLLGLAVCGGVALSRWRAAEGIPAIPDPPTTTRQRLVAAAPSPVIEPPPLQVRGVPARRREGPPAAAPLPPEGPLEARGGPAHAAAPGAEEALRERIRRRQLTIARSDRRLLDLLDRKGDVAVAAPAAAAELDTGRGTLAPAAVRRTLRRSAGGYSTCVTRALKLEPRLRVDGRRVTLDLTVRPSGIVGDARLEAPDLARTGLARCLLETARRMVFPAFDGRPTEVSVPLALSAVR